MKKDHLLQEDGRPLCGTTNLQGTTFCLPSHLCEFCLDNSLKALEEPANLCSKCAHNRVLRFYDAAHDLPLPRDYLEHLFGNVESPCAFERAHIVSAKKRGVFLDRFAF